MRTRAVGRNGNVTRAILTHRRHRNVLKRVTRRRPRRVAENSKNYHSCEQ